MNKMQMKGVAEILKKRFNNLSASETMGLCYDIVEVVLNQASPDQFPKWSTSATKLDNIRTILNNTEDGWEALNSVKKIIGDE